MNFTDEPLSSTTHGVPLWNVDFSGDTPGQPPATQSAVAGEINSLPTSVSAAGSGNSVLVQSSFTAGSATLSNNPVVFTYQTTDTGTGVTLGLTGAADDFESPARYELFFDFIISSTDLGAGNTLEARLTNSTSNAANASVARFILTGSGNLILFPFDGSNVTFEDRWDPDTLMSAHLVVDPFANQFTMNLTGASGGPTSDSVTIGGDLADRGIRNINFRNGTTSANGTWTGAIDNIVGIPEPGSFLLGLAGLFLLALRRRK